MPPRRPLPELCLIALYKQLTPNDQLIAARMSPRSRVLVRTANRRIKTLSIRTWNSYVRIERTLNPLSCPSRQSLQLTADSVPYFRYLLSSNRFSRWNVLLLVNGKEQVVLDSSTVDLIVYLFSAVTDLKIASFCGPIECENIAKLLQHQEWASQLTQLVLAWDTCWCDWGEVCKHDSHPFNRTSAERVTAAVNRLSALQCLILSNFCNIDYYKLTITAQLKWFYLAICRNSGCTDLPKFLGQTDKLAHAADQQQRQQQVHLFLGSSLQSPNRNGAIMQYNSWPGLNRLTSDLLSKFDSSCIADIYWLIYTPERHDWTLRLVTQYSSLVSLSVSIRFTSSTPWQTTLASLFTVLSHLKQLIYLELWANLGFRLSALPSPKPLSVQLPSVRALDLVLTVSSHDQIEWLNLAHTLPNCQGVHLHHACTACKVDTYYFTENLADYVHKDYKEVHLPAALNCLRTTLSLLHQGVHPSKLIFAYGPLHTELDKPFGFEECSFEELMLKFPASQQ